MSDSTFDPAITVAALNTSLLSLEEALSNLHSKAWSETRESLSTLERAEMDILLAYAINDLTWGKYPTLTVYLP